MQFFMLFQRLWVIIVILFLLIPAMPCAAENIEFERSHLQAPTDSQELETFLDRFFTARMPQLHVPGAAFAANRATVIPLQQRF